MSSVFIVACRMVATVFLFIALLGWMAGMIGGMLVMIGLFKQ